MEISNSQKSWGNWACANMCTRLSFLCPCTRAWVQGYCLNRPAPKTLMQVETRIQSLNLWTKQIVTLLEHPIQVYRMSNHSRRLSSMKGVGGGMVLTQHTFKHTLQVTPSQYDGVNLIKFMATLNWKQLPVTLFPSHGVLTVCERASAPWSSVLPPGLSPLHINLGGVRNTKPTRPYQNDSAF